MPWCTHCDRYLSPSTVHTDGTCPSCGRAVNPGHPTTTTTPASTLGTTTRKPSTGKPSTDDEQPEPLPWHFKLLLVALAIYLAYRAFQGVEWLIALL